MVVARPQPQADQRARVGHGLRLPAVICLIAPHGIFTGLIPRTGRFAGHIMLAYQRFLDSLRPLGIDFLLSPRCLLFFAALARTRVLRFTVMSRRGRTRIWVFIRRRMRRGMSLGRGFGRGRNACASTLRRGRSVFLRARRRGVRSLSLSAAACRRVSRRRLPQRRARRSARTHQGQSAACAPPSSYLGAMRPARFQRQPSEDQRPVLRASKNHCAILSAFTDHWPLSSALKQNPTESGIVIIRHRSGPCQFPLGQSQVTEVFRP